MVQPASRRLVTEDELDAVDAALDARVTALEADDTGWMQLNVSPASGWGITLNQYRVKNGVPYVWLRLDYVSGPDITSNGYGNVGDRTIANIDLSFCPAGTMGYAVYLPTVIPGYTVATTRVQPGGDVILCGAGPNMTIKANQAPNSFELRGDLL